MSISPRLIHAAAVASDRVYDVFLSGADTGDAVAFDENGSHILCLKTPEYLMVAWQGTDSSNWRDVASNMRIDPKPTPLGGWAHAGYLSYTLKGWGPVRGWLEQNADGRPVYATGHSRGGAAATVALQFWHHWTAAITFGAPKPGNLAFWAAIKAPVYRVTIESDFAPEHPTVFGIPVPGYWQGGEQLMLDQFGLTPVEWKPMANRGRQDRSPHNSGLYRTWAAMAAALSTV